MRNAIVELRRRMITSGVLCLAVAVLPFAILTVHPAKAPAVREIHQARAARGAGNCGDYQCFIDAGEFLASTPAPQPGQVATVPLASRAIGPPTGRPSLLVGLDNGPWSFWKVSDGFAQGRSGLIGGISAGNVYNFDHWQYVDELYYYLHATVSVPPTQWVNAAHRNGVPVLGTVTGDCPGCGEQATKLFSPANYQKTVKKLYDYAVAYGFDGWVIDMEADFQPAAGVLSAVKDLVAMKLPDGQPVRVAVYHGGETSIQPEPYGMLPYFKAGAEWQSDYDLSPQRSNSPAESYQTLVASQLGSQIFRAYWASYVYADAYNTNCPEGQKITATQIWNGNSASGLPIKCLDTKSYFANLGSVRGSGAPPFYTSAAIYAPDWTYFQNLRDATALVSRESVHAADDAFWVGYQVRYTGPACVRTGTDNAVSALISPRSVIGGLPFVTDFNEGEGDVYAVQGTLATAQPWNNLSAQDLLPTWYCAQGGGLNVAPVYATARDGDAFNGGSALKLTGSGGEVKLYATNIPVSPLSRPVLAFTAKTVTGAPPYIRVFYSDGTSQRVPSAASGPGWQETTSPLQAQGKTITAIAVGADSSGGPVSSVLGQLRLYDAATDVRPTRIDVTSDSDVITWSSSQKVAISYWNVYADAGSCVRLLGPAFTNRYDLTQSMFALGPRPPRFIIQPVSTTGLPAVIPPICGPQ